MSGQPSLDQRFADNMGQLLGPDFPNDIALAVSGGGDSMAMLTLAHNWARVWGVRLWVVTVDHGLRAESAAEAAMVAEECTVLGHPHTTLRWHWDGQGNLMDAARRARLSLIDRWRAGLEHVLMAHTQDDVAETFLMRLKRGSGVEGLAAMQASANACPHPGGKPALPARDVCWTTPPPASVDGHRQSRGFRVLRPCLDMSRAELRHYLRTLQGRWFDDPTNDDTTYDRVRMRKLLDVLEAEGLDRETLSATAHRLTRARNALNARARDVAGRIAKEETLNGLRTGAVLIDRDGFAEAEDDTRLRILAQALRWVASAEYRPRLQSLEQLAERLMAGGMGTLHGCDVRCVDAQIRVGREFSAVSAPAQPGKIWDGCWQTCGDVPNGSYLRALGPDGLKQAGGRPRGAPVAKMLYAFPAAFRAEVLVACPHLGYGEKINIQRMDTGSSFAASFVLH
ncbi:tRNA lysidine(34) synthetase TilS [Primorskyibacter flagellatus]|uniref:tRNA lysidine(34) synthetase TilS n=1 Tax=Primorskyibacter flagellatus TaxID=1387277 RepID=UPI003A8F959E